MLDAAAATTTASEVSQMSTPPPPPPGFAPPPKQSSGFPWMACGIGCLILVVLLLAVGGFVAYKAKQAFEGMQASFERMEEVSQRQAAARERIASLDEAHPSSLGEDLSTAELVDGDLEQFLGLHAALSEALAAHEEVKARVREFEEKMEQLDGNEEPSFSDAMGMFSGMKDALSAEFESEETMAALLEQAAVHMDEQGIGRTKLRRLCAIIQWQFLEREGFEELALPFEEWSSLQTARSQVELWGEDEFDPEYWEKEEWKNFQKTIVEHRVTIERLEAKLAEAKGGLSVGTRAKLESRRAELEAISAEDALAILELTRPEQTFDWDFGEAEESSEGEASGAGD